MTDAKPKKAREVKCKMCASRFVKKSIAHVCCSPLCAIEWGRKEKVRKLKQVDVQAAKARKERQDRVKTISWWLARAQVAFNRYVRLRDVNLGCISCDKPSTWSGQWHASHYRSVGSNTNLRFHLWNVNKACVQCNHFLGGNVGHYRDGLIERRGQGTVDFLESSTNTRRFDREYLERLTAIFTKKFKRLEKRLEGR